MSISSFMDAPPNLPNWIESYVDEFETYLAWVRLKISLGNFQCTCVIQRISKILFVLKSWNDFKRVEGRIETGAFSKKHWNTVESLSIRDWRLNQTTPLPSGNNSVSKNQVYRSHKVVPNTQVLNKLLHTWL